MMVKKTKKGKKGGAQMAGKLMKVQRVPRSLSVLADRRIRAYDELLRDPCSADLAYPPYTGTDAGYLVRTTDLFEINATAPNTLTVGTGYTANYGFIYTPGAVPQPVVAAGAQLGTATKWQYAGINGSGITPATPSYTNFVFSGVAEAVRPVACCLKWIPIGAAAARSGSVALGYTPSNPFAGQTGFNTANLGPAFDFRALHAQAQKYDGNGTTLHEVRWLPTLSDEAFVPVVAGAADPPVGKGGSVFVALWGVDGVANTTSNILLSGLIEVTTVWEWIPATANIGPAQSRVTVTPRAPLPYSTQQVLASIEDLGAYVFHGVRQTARAAASGMMQGAVHAALGVLGTGMRPSGVRPNAMPTIMAM